MHSPDARDPSDDALELFAGWLTRREAGAADEFDALVREHPALAADLRALHANWLDLAAADQLSEALVEPERAGVFDARTLTARLAARASTSDRYTDQGEVARGGMGAIRRVFDRDFRRALAMKVALPNASAPAQNRASPQILARFLAEAQITGQLDHPGIVPVHELGLDDDGRLYFTMKLVEGRDLRHIFQLVFEAREDWNVTRALGVLLKVCEAVAYAHKKGVIHRDLKPANIMVGSFGEVYVMDWGLARELGAAEPKDLPLASSDDTGVHTDRGDTRAHDAESALLTVEGDVLGTPAYMPPEQARGEIDKLTPQSDVYSLGAMLYHLLARQVPYVPDGVKVTHKEVLARVVEGPPRSLSSIDHTLPAELVAICEKATAREPHARYPDMLALADDLRAYLERRVVAAYEAGALAEMKKWIARNKALATASAGVVVSLLIGLIVSSSLYVKADRATDLADAKAKEAEHRTDDVFSLSAIRDLEALIQRADAAWPAHPENIPRYEAWLADARMLLDGRPGDPATGQKSKPGLADHKRKLAEIELRGTRVSTPDADGTSPAAADWQFASTEDLWWHTQLARLITDIESFADPATGIVFEGASPIHGWGITKRLAEARAIEERSVSGADVKRRWEEAIASIADREQCPAYDGLALSPQLGLVPIGRDPASGLWEFSHVETGEIAARGADGKLVMSEHMGLVFVLVPGATFTMGAQSIDPALPGYDALGESAEGPVHEVTLDPFFISKFEMTQWQWLFFCGVNPSLRPPGTSSGGKPVTHLNPVNQVSWRDCTKILPRMELTLPTEAQWEFAAAAGTKTSWITGDAPESLQGSANLADAYCKQNGGPASWEFDDWLDDGYATSAPVGTYLPNRFGLHDMHGNVWEWCADGYDSYEKPVEPGTGLRVTQTMSTRPVRSGSFADVARNVRTRFRTQFPPDDRDLGLGVRPARAWTR
ncbi:MAG: SUMF1/EgtB/PvdO family nonheme iron enzyme [Planctomycetes bacterium]|nr:SUMF1/EgtB/PvdO family nonheme iron enzyme [Planctomycetota bacterium]